jgi:hypothetical protein
MTIFLRFYPYLQFIPAFKGKLGILMVFFCQLTKRALKSLISSACKLPSSEVLLSHLSKGVTNLSNKYFIEDSMSESGQDG